MDTVSVVQFPPDLYFVFGNHKNIQWVVGEGKKKNPDDYTMDGNPLL